jgi:RNA polymerase sigma factor (sigma-70 family)
MPPPAEEFVARFLVGPTLRTQSDGRLVKLVRDGYEAAFEEIVRRYGSALRRYAARIADRNAEDVTQDAFSRALLAMRRDDNEIELRPWLFRIVRNTALNDLRNRPPSAETLAETLVAGGRGPAEEMERREELADLMRRLGSLPEPQRAAIVMRELEGLGHEEIAAALGLSGGAARQAIYRARRALRNGLGMLLPLPLLKGLMGGTVTGPTEAAVGAAGVGGAGAALKAATATVLVVSAVGAGVALDGRHDHGPPPASAATPTRGDRFATPVLSTAPRVNGTSIAELPGEADRKRSGDPAPETSGDGERRGHGPGGTGHDPNSGGEDRGGHSPGPGVDAAGEESLGGSDDGTSGSSGHGTGENGDSSGPGSGEGEAPASEEGPSSGEGSGPGSEDSGSSESSEPGGGSSGQTSDDLGDPHGSSVFSVQEPNPQEDR